MRIPFLFNVVTKSPHLEPGAHPAYKEEKLPLQGLLDPGDSLHASSFSWREPGFDRDFRGPNEDF